MADEQSDLEGWTFKVREVSMNWYVVHGVDEAGRTVRSVGADHDALIRKCKEWAADITRRSREHLPRPVGSVGAAAAEDGGDGAADERQVEPG
jgi:hypothetical protein